MEEKSGGPSPGSYKQNIVSLCSGFRWLTIGRSNYYSTVGNAISTGIAGPFTLLPFYSPPQAGSHSTDKVFPSCRYAEAWDGRGGGGLKEGTHTRPNRYGPFMRPSLITYAEHRNHHHRAAALHYRAKTGSYKGDLATKSEMMLGSF